MTDKVRSTGSGHRTGTLDTDRDGPVARAARPRAGDFAPRGLPRPLEGYWRFAWKNASTLASSCLWKASRSKPFGSTQISGTSFFMRAEHGARKAKCAELRTR